jgi:hypothetical protein
MRIRAIRTKVIEFDVNPINYPKEAKTFEDIVRIERLNFENDPDLMFETDFMFDEFKSDEVKFELVEE